MKKAITYYFLIACILCTGIMGSAQNYADTVKAEDLIQLSFQELMSIEISTGTLTNIERAKVPASITLITREEIEHTPARNLLDLLEIYVPDGNFVNHWLGSRIGIRGIMSDQNNSFLLLVNGKTMNFKSQDGATTEIQNRELSDIESIEIISGPGSVTYGPGAIGGVISIVTKNASTSDRAKLGMEHNFKYRYSTLNGNFALRKEKFSASLFASVSTSKGIKDPEFYYIDRAHGYGYGYMSENWGNKGLGTPAPNFYADFEDKPEIKVQFDINFLKKITFWTRYSNFNFIKQQQQVYSKDGPVFPGQNVQQYTAALDYKHAFSQKSQWNTTGSFSSINYRDVRLYQGRKKPFDDITQRNNSFSENNIALQSLFTHQSSNKLKLAIGGEYNYWYYQPQWGKKDEEYVHNFAPPVKFGVLSQNSGFYKQYFNNGLVTLLETPINAHQFSVLYEINYSPLPQTTFLVSGRLDKHNLAELAFSPRLAIIQQINKNHLFKLIAQQSVRLPNYRELYAMNYASNPHPAPERLRGVELIYANTHLNNLSFQLSGFYQSVDQIAWTPQNYSDFVGNFKTTGLTANAKYSRDKLKATLSYSYIKQLEWQPEEEFNAYLSNIGTDSLKYKLIDAGNNRQNNMPQHQIKFVSSYRLNRSFSFHFNARFASAYGQKDMLNMFKMVHDQYGDNRTRNEMAAIYSDLKDKGYAQPSFTSNISASYTFRLLNAELELSSWIMNLFTVNHVRYVYQFWEQGNNRQYPRHVGFIEEPLSFGIRLTAKL